MTAREIVALNESTPQLEVPQSGDSYVMPRDVDHANNAISGVKQLTIAGDSANYTAFPTGYIIVSASHTYDYSNLRLPYSVYFSGTHTIKQSAFVFGMGALFVAAATIKNDSATAANMAGFYGLSCGITFQADTQSITLGTQTDIISNTKFNRINGGSLAVTSWNQYQAQGTVAAGATVTNRRGYQVINLTIGGTVTSQAGFVCDALTGATNNTNLLLGTTTIPSGDFNIYQGGTKVNRWNAGHRQKRRASSSTSVTLTVADFLVTCSSTSTVTATLPDATTCDGLELIIKKTGASGTVNVTSVSSQTFDGSAGPIAISTQHNLVHVISDGSNWLVLRNGAP